MILVELEAAVLADGTVERFYVSTDGFVTEPTDTPANREFKAVLIEPGSIGVSAFADGKTSGTSQLQAGALRLANIDGQFDAWVTYSFDGRPVTIRSGDTGAYPSDFPVIFTGTVEKVEATTSSIDITLRDKAFILDKPVLTTLYAGTNVGPIGLEGVAGDLKGKVKPRTYGAALNVGPPCVNTAKLTYQVSDGPVAAISAVYDRGASLTPGVDHSTSALLTAATVSAGTYQTCLAEGFFRIGSSPTGQITADVTQGATVAVRTVAQIIKALALAAGVPAGDIDAEAVAALDIDAPQVIGLHLNGDTTFRAAMDMAAASVGAWWAFDPQGVLRMGQLSTPSGSADADFIEADVLKGFERRASDGDGLPVSRVVVRHSKFWTVQSSDVATSVGDARRSELANEYRSTDPAEDPAVKAQYAQARELVIDTLLTSEADGDVEAARQLALRKVRRDLFDVPVPVSVFAEARVRLGRTVKLTHSRFGLSAGKNLLLIGYDLDLGRRRVIMKLGS